MLRTPDWSSSLLFFLISYILSNLLPGKFPQLYLPFILLMFSFLISYIYFPRTHFFVLWMFLFFNIFVFLLFLWKYLSNCVYVCVIFISLCNLFSLTCFCFFWLFNIGSLIIEICLKCLFIFDCRLIFKRGALKIPEIGFSVHIEKTMCLLVG